MTQEQALEILKSGKNAFLTGPAGAGKTFVLNRYINWLKTSGANIAITASTGIAATHLDGITIHSWTGMGVRDQLSLPEVKELTKRSYLKRRFLRTSVLIIDEVSMLAGYQLDLADILFRAFKQIDLPFGGVQVVLCGDFFQLPPIVRIDRNARRSSLFEEAAENLDSGVNFIYNSRAWKDLDLKICYLDEQHRQSDMRYLETLNAIRANAVDEQVCCYLRERINAKIDMPVAPTRLYTHNANVEIENDLELEKINAKEYRYQMELIGPSALTEHLRKGCLAPQNLRLKIGARVMFVKNNFEEGYVNGTLGVVEKLDEQRIMVRTATGSLIDVGPASWHISEEGEIKSEIVQYPLRLAWAITIHKSQGMSLDAAVVDLRRSFEPGMGYVALSRVRSLAGLSLLGFNQIALEVNREVLKLDDELKSMSQKHGRELLSRRLPERKFEKPALAAKIKKPDTVELTRQLLEKKFPLEQIAKLRDLKIGTILDHCEKIKKKNQNFDFSHLVKIIPAGKLIFLKSALKKCKTETGIYPLSPAMELAGDDTSYEDLRLARLML